MVTAADFEQFIEHLQRNKIDRSEYIDAFNERFPDRHDQMAYVEWYMCDMRRNDLVDVLDNMSLYDKAAPSIALDGNLYRLAPDAFALHPSSVYNEAQHGAAVGSPLRNNFLSINIPADTLRKDQQSLYESAGSAETALGLKLAEPGFLFHQLGALQYTNNREEPGPPPINAEGSGRKDWKWMSTGYFLVARVAPDDGRVNGIYALFDPTGEREDRVYDDDYSESGISGSSRRKIVNADCRDLGFAAARLRDRLGGSSFEVRMEWKEWIDGPFELVRVQRRSDGKLERVAAASIVEAASK